jgi:hypothetical protein
LELQYGRRVLRRDPPRASRCQRKRISRYQVMHPAQEQ